MNEEQLLKTSAMKIRFYLILRKVQTDSKSSGGTLYELACKRGGCCIKQHSADSSAWDWKRPNEGAFHDNWDRKLRNPIAAFTHIQNKKMSRSHQKTSKGSGYITKDVYFGQTVNRPYSMLEESGGYQMNKVRAGVTEDHVPLK